MTKEENKIALIFCSVCGVLSVILISFIIAISNAGVFDDINEKPDPTADEIAEDIVRMECRNRTNDYQKCSWSVFEDRCVCKLR